MHGYIVVETLLLWLLKGEPTVSIPFLAQYLRIVLL